MPDETRYSNQNTESSAFSSVKTPRARHDTGTGSFSIPAAAGVTHVMSRPVLAKIKLMISAGAAKPAPPVGPALGQHGLNIMEFCKAFNAKTADFIPDAPIPVVITAYKDKSFEWEMKSPPVTYFVKKAAGVGGGGQRPGHEVKGTVSLKHVYHIAKVKEQDAGSLLSLKQLCRGVIATAKSAGIRVVR